MVTPRSLAMNLGNKRLQERFEDPEMTGQNVGARLAEKSAQGRRQFTDTLRQNQADQHTAQINQILAKNRQATQNWNRLRAMQQGQGNNMTLEGQYERRQGRDTRERDTRGRVVPQNISEAGVQGMWNRPPPRPQPTGTPQGVPMAPGNMPGVRDVEAGRPQPPLGSRTRPTPQELGMTGPLSERTVPTPEEMGMMARQAQAPMASPMPQNFGQNWVARAQNPYAYGLAQSGILNQTQTPFPQRFPGNMIRPQFTYGLNPNNPMWANASQFNDMSTAGSPWDYYQSPLVNQQGLDMGTPPGPNVPRAPGSTGWEGVYRQWNPNEINPQGMQQMMQQYGGQWPPGAIMNPMFNPLMNR